VYSEDELLPISALQHLLFCERQCALIHIEQVWEENRLTAEGRLMHERVHEADNETRGDVRIVRGLRLRSLQLGLSGVADVVEFHRADSGVRLSGATGLWLPFPVEYKRGRPKAEPWDAVQLCAQASCLEEMLSVVIPAGALFYGATRRREDVAFDERLRSVLRETAERLRLLFEVGTTPQALYEKKCGNCSLLHLCMPRTAGRGKSAASYLASGIVA
jgi:CRISPR-associated exonuclease Cas4